MVNIKGMTDEQMNEVPELKAIAWVLGKSEECTKITGIPSPFDVKLSRKSRKLYNKLSKEGYTPERKDMIIALCIIMGCSPTEVVEYLEYIHGILPHGNA